jgi:hypothetical protein
MIEVSPSQENPAGLNSIHLFVDGALAAASYPEASDVPGMPTVFRRRWVLRVRSTLPARDILEDTVKSFELSVRRAIVEALELPGDIELTLPVVSVVRLDDHYLVLEIDCPIPDAQKGDETTIATVGVLRAADARWQVLDIQGIPRRYWSILGLPGV